MRVGIVAYALDRPVTGIQRYTLELVRSLMALPHAPEVFLLTAGPRGPHAQKDWRSARLPGCRRLPGLMTFGNVFIPWQAARRGLDVVHDPNGVAPFLLGAGPAHTVVTVHDAIPWVHPETSALLERWIYRYWLPGRLPRVDAVITVSKRSKADLQRYLPLPADSAHVIPYGVDPRFRPLPGTEVQARLVKRFGLTDPYVLYVGALNRRKNIVRLLEAFASLRAGFDRMRLVLAGPPAGGHPRLDMIVDHLGLRDRVLRTGPLTDADLPALYNGASLFVFPSLYEGFGLPPLEAMACGAPVVCSHASSLPEVVGEAAVLVDPSDTADLAHSMRRVLADPALRTEMRARGLERARHFTWERTARETLAVYRSILQ